MTIPLTPFPPPMLFSTCLRLPLLFSPPFSSSDGPILRVRGMLPSQEERNESTNPTSLIRTPSFSPPYVVESRFLLQHVEQETTPTIFRATHCPIRFFLCFHFFLPPSTESLPIRRDSYFTIAITSYGCECALPFFLAQGFTTIFPKLKLTIFLTQRVQMLATIPFFFFSFLHDIPGLSLGFGTPPVFFSFFDEWHVFDWGGKLFTGIYLSPSFFSFSNVAAFF